MRVSSYSGFGGISYQYNKASQLTTATMSGSEPYTQSFSYDPAGRLSGVTTPDISAPSQYITTTTNPYNGLPSGFHLKPFDASLTYDEFGNMTGRSSQYWSGFSASGNPNQTFATTYENGRAKKDGVAVAPLPTGRTRPGHITIPAKSSMMAGLRSNMMSRGNSPERKILLIRMPGPITRTMAMDAKLSLSKNWPMFIIPAAMK